MQTDDQGPPSAAPKTPSGAAGGSLRDLLATLRSFVDQPTIGLPPFHFRSLVLSQRDIRLVLDELDTQWIEILVLRAKLPKITHDEAQCAATRIQNFEHGTHNCQLLLDYIKQQRDDERRRDERERPRGN
jgi:hypothetical protein